MVVAVTRWRREVLLDLGQRLIERLGPVCERIEVAGSMRRGRPAAKDLELLAVPRMRDDLTGEPTIDCLEEEVGALVRSGRLAWRRGDGGGAAPRRAYSLLVGGRVPLDLYAVHPPASWGVLLAIRTGPAEWSRDLVTLARKRGWRVEGGALMRGSYRADTPEERDVFRALRLPYVDPADRDRIAEVV